MNDEFFLEILYSVFEKDTKAFSCFIECEIDYAYRFKEDETELLLWAIEEQLRYITKKKEDAQHASSRIVDLIQNIKKFK